MLSKFKVNEFNKKEMIWNLCLRNIILLSSSNYMYKNLHVIFCKCGRKSPEPATKPYWTGIIKVHVEKNPTYVYYV